MGRVLPEETHLFGVGSAEDVAALAFQESAFNLPQTPVFEERNVLRSFNTQGGAVGSPLGAGDDEVQGYLGEALTQILHLPAPLIVEGQFQGALENALDVGVGGGVTDEVEGGHGFSFFSSRGVPVLRGQKTDDIAYEAGGHTPDNVAIVFVKIDWIAAFVPRIILPADKFVEGLIGRRGDGHGILKNAGSGGLEEFQGYRKNLGDLVR